LDPTRAMRLALREARRASGRTFPNPPVGAVVFRGPRVLGRGFTQPPGGAHAEVRALAAAVRRHGARALRGASMAVTLEPCAHTGRTAPCTQALIAAGLRTVWVGHRDPHPFVAGRGVRELRRAGLRVELGVLAEECRAQHRGFLARVERGLPFLALKLAASLDGRIATAAGESRWITGPRARSLVHQLRARSDAVLVGAGTVLADDPELFARRGGRVVHRPLRVVADSRLRVPLDARLYSDGYPDRTWVLCAADASSRRQRALRDRGVRVLTVARAKGTGSISARRALRGLAREGVGEILCEGGGTLAAALLKADLVDELLWFVAPTLLGGDARPALGPLGLKRLAQAPRLRIRRERRLGEDRLIEAVRRGEEIE